MPEEMPRTFGKYEILEPLGREGGARIYLARQTTVDRLVTLTILSQEEAGRAAFQTRFERQIAAASRLSHPNIVRAVDAGTIEGHRYIASEHAGGRRLATALAEGEYFPMRSCLSIAHDVANALVHLQQNGIIHRGITPRSVLLAESGVAKLRGFSLSKLLESSSSETWFDVDRYTACYTSPEMANVAGRVDGRTDIYSFGCVVYHTVTGRPPFTGESTIEVFQKHMGTAAPDPRTLRERTPAGLVTVLENCIARDPDARYSTASALVDDLRAVRSDPSVTPLSGPDRSGIRSLFDRG